MIQALEKTNPNASEADERKQSRRTKRNNEINCEGLILNLTCAVVRVQPERVVIDLKPSNESERKEVEDPRKPYRW